MPRMLVVLFTAAVVIMSSGSVQAHHKEGHSSSGDACSQRSSNDESAPRCSEDDDADGTANEEDNCPHIANARQEDGDGDGVGDACDTAPTPENGLVVAYNAGDGLQPQQRWALTCAESATGNHPQAQQACDRLESLDDPFAPIPADLACAQEYFGPQTAHVTGWWNGDPVDLQLFRRDACERNQWDSLVPLVPDPCWVFGVTVAPWIAVQVLQCVGPR